MRRRLASTALALYPQAWRERYGEEVTALIEQGPPRIAAIFDLLRGAADAHLHPRGAQPPSLDRMRNSVSATLCCWIAFVFAGAGFAKLTEDPPFARAAHSHNLLGGAKTAVMLFAVLASVAVLIGGASLAASVLREAWRRRDGRQARAVSGTIVAVAPFALVTAIGAVLAHMPGTPAPAVRVIFFAVWVTSAVVTAVGCGIGARAVLLRSHLQARSLRTGVRGAAVVSLSMALIATAGAIYLAVLLTDSPGLAASPNTPFNFATSLLLAVDVVLMGTAATLGAITSLRGLHALRSLAR